MKNLNTYGALSAFYLAAVYIVGIILFLFVLDYPNIVEPAQKVAMLASHTSLLYVSNLLMYILFGFVLITLLVSIYTRFKKPANPLITIATIVGSVWACLLIGSGMVANAGITSTLQIYESNPEQAALFWLGIEAVTTGLGGGNGEILGGVMTLLISIAGIQEKIFARGLHYLGIVIGIIGIVSTIPGLGDLVGLFGISQIVWFIWVGNALIRKPVPKK